MPAHTEGNKFNTADGTPVSWSDVFLVKSQTGSKFSSSERFIDNAVYCMTASAKTAHACCETIYGRLFPSPYLSSQPSGLSVTAPNHSYFEQQVSTLADIEVRQVGISHYSSIPRPNPYLLRPRGPEAHSTRELLTLSYQALFSWCHPPLGRRLPETHEPEPFPNGDLPPWV